VLEQCGGDLLERVRAPFHDEELFGRAWVAELVRAPPSLLDFVGTALTAMVRNALSVFVAHLLLGYTTEVLPCDDRRWRPLAAFLCRWTRLVLRAAMLRAPETCLPQFDARFRNGCLCELQIWRFLDGLAAQNQYYSDQFDEALRRSNAHLCGFAAP
jgi:hypothetical protein